jgi:hypothetical protein
LIFSGGACAAGSTADAILWTRTAIAFMADNHGRSITAWDCLVRRLQRLAWPPIDEALERRDGNARADASRSRGNGGTRRYGSDDDKGPQEMTVRARHGVVADLASRRTPISSHHI